MEFDSILKHSGKWKTELLGPFDVLRATIKVMCKVIINNYTHNDNNPVITNLPIVWFQMNWSKSRIKWSGLIKKIRLKKSQAKVMQ